MMIGQAGKTMEAITFYEQAKGSSHTISGQPCQDNGLCFEKDGVYIAIVCDGHGGESYVRSHKGSLFAAEIARDKILEFIKCESASLLEGKVGAVTAIPTVNPLKDKNGNKIDFNSLSESQQDLTLQNKAYIDESAKHSDIEHSFRQLFRVIVGAWRSAIQEDSTKYPFSDKEKEKLGHGRLEKAYGTTLMAAVCTPNYWFAFHIGDGKLLVCNKLMEWKEPVPWDYNCFLNFTTSLCDKDPFMEFRYAFDGTGQFPLAFALGSDGIDDTFITSELTHKFYSQMLCVFEKYSKDEALEYLRNHLPILSKKGSHDDMSVAAIITTSHLSLSVQYYKTLSEVRELNNERSKKENVLKTFQHQIKEQSQSTKQLSKENNEFYQQAWIRYLSFLEKRQKDLLEIEQRQSKRVKSEMSINKLKIELGTLQNDFDEWMRQSKASVDNLRVDAERLKNQLYTLDNVTDDSINNVVVVEDIIIQEEPQNNGEHSLPVVLAPIKPEEEESLDEISNKQTKEILNLNR